MSVKKIAIFGGTFNPIHNGHINLCSQISDMYKFDKVIIIPSNIPPHKKVQYLASNEDRFNMCKLATKNNSLFEVSDIEFKMQGLSYTFNTIKLLKQEYENADFYLIVGSDMLYIFDKWYKYEQILQEVTLISSARFEEEYEKMTKYCEKLGELAKKIDVVRTNVLTMSSTFIREQLAIGENAMEYLDKEVYEYIREKKLY